MSFISYLISGISLGSIYALIALGYTMVYGIAKMLNFAHGDIIMVGGYAVFTAMSTAWCPVWLSVIIGIVVCTVLGVVIEKVAYKPLRNAPPLAVLITAIGVSYLLQNLALLIFGSAAQNFTSVVDGMPPFLIVTDNGAQFFTAAEPGVRTSLKVSMETFLSIVVSLIIMAALTWFINKTKAGKRHACRRRGQGRCAAHGYQRKRYYLPYIRDRLRAGWRCERADVLRLSAAQPVHRLYAWYQGVRCGGIRRHRLHSGSDDRRRTAGNNRAACKGLHILTAFRRDSVPRADNSSGGKTHRHSRQEDPRKGLRGREHDKDNKEQLHNLRHHPRIVRHFRRTLNDRRSRQPVFRTAHTDRYLHYPLHLAEPHGRYPR